MEQESTDLRMWLPKSWYGVPTRKIMFSAFRVARASLDAFSGEPIVFDLLGSRVIIFWGRPRYISGQVGVDFAEGDSVRFAVKKPRITEAPDGRYCIIGSLFDSPNTDTYARAQTDAVVGLLYAQSGRNIAYDCIYEIVVDLKSNKSSLSTQWIENPLALPVPRINKSDVRKLVRVTKSLSSQPEAERRRLLLSLRWFRTAVSESGPDALLRYWVALEALAMPSTANIRPLVQRLARIYDVSDMDARREFKIPRFLRARSQEILSNVVDRSSA